MKRHILIIGVLLIVAHVLTELHSILYAIYHSIQTLSYDVFWSKSFKMKLSVQWILKMNFDDLLVIALLFVAAYIARKYSRRLFLILLIWICYHVADILLFWYNYKSDADSYWNMIVFCTAETVMLFLPLREEKRKYRSLI